MRRRLFIIAIFLLVAVGFTSQNFAAKPGTGAVPNQIGVVQCGQTVTIYQQYITSNDMDVTVTVSDFCSGLNSRLLGFTGSGLPQKDITVLDGNTTTVGFLIGHAKSGGKIELECIGDSGEGFCIYKIEDIK